MFLLLTLIGCIVLLLLISRLPLRRIKTPEENRKVSLTYTCIVLGSGGHTAEMLKIISSLPSHYTPRLYLIGNDDSLSFAKVEKWENECNTQHGRDWFVSFFPRPRSVGQSKLSSIIPTIRTFISVASIFWSNNYPQLVLTNGPGIAVPVVIACTLARFAPSPPKVVYIESIARVKSISLSGKLIFPFVNRFVVCWPEAREALLKMIPSFIHPYINIDCLSQPSLNS